MKHFILQKARSHKYIRRLGTSRNYRYIYATEPGKTFRMEGDQPHRKYTKEEIDKVIKDFLSGVMTDAQATQALIKLGYWSGAAKRKIMRLGAVAKPQVVAKPHSAKLITKPAVMGAEEKLKWAHRKVHHDVGVRVGGAKKEKYFEVNANNINQLEAEGVKEAYDKVTKDAVFPKMEWETEKAMGVTAGAAYFKKQFIGAIASRPPDSPGMREAYVHSEKYVMDSLAHCKTVGDVQDFIMEFAQLTKKKKLDRIISDAEFAPLMVIDEEGHKYHSVPDALKKLYPGVENKYGTIVAEQTADKKNWKIYVPSDDPTPYADYVRSFGPRFEGIVHDYLVGLGWGRHGRISSFWAKDRRKAQAFEKNDDWSWSGKKVAGEKKKRFEWERAAEKDVNRIGGQEAPKKTTADNITKSFNLRGVEYGNWINDDDAKYHINKAWEALSDLGDILGIDPKDTSLNGRLSLAIGARGSGKARAHYEPLKKIVNLTKFSGGGCLAHEWGHAFDNVMAEASLISPKGEHYYFSEGVITNYVKPEAHNVKFAFDNVMSTIMKGDPEVIKEALSKKSNEIHEMRMAYYAEKEPVEKEKKRQAINEAVKSYRNVARLKGTTYYNTAVTLGEYWKRPRELFARAFESYVEDKLEHNQRKNTYLVTGTKVPYAIHIEGIADSLEPYPRGAEREKINLAMDALMERIRNTAALKKALEDMFRYVILEKAERDKYFYIDFDRTLAHHEPGQDIKVLGEPIPKMLNRVKRLIAQGKKVKIFTARAQYGDKAKMDVQDWLEKYGLPRLEVTNMKLDDVLEIWDDKAKQVKPNKGEIK